MHTLACLSQLSLLIETPHTHLQSPTPAVTHQQLSVSQSLRETDATSRTAVFPTTLLSAAKKYDFSGVGAEKPQVIVEEDRDTWLDGSSFVPRAGV